MHFAGAGDRTQKPTSAYGYCESKHFRQTTAIYERETLSLSSPPITRLHVCARCCSWIAIKELRVVLFRLFGKSRFARVYEKGNISSSRWIVSADRVPRLGDRLFSDLQSVPGKISSWRESRQTLLNRVSFPRSGGWLWLGDSAARDELT